MRRSREVKDPDRSVTSWLPEVDPVYRDAVDPDPLVEAMVGRLRSSLSGLMALDEFGRPVPWRNVVRIALGPTLGQLRDVETSLALMQEVGQRPPHRVAAPPPAPAPSAPALQQPPAPPAPPSLPGWP